MYSPVGTCSLCGGPVVIFRGPWMGVEPPKPHCSKCGAVPKTSLPVIEMTGGTNESTQRLLHS